MTRPDQPFLGYSLGKSASDGFRLLPSRVPSLGEVVTGLGSKEAWRDLKRLALILGALPVGLGGIQVLRFYGSKKLFSKESPTEEDTGVSISSEDYYKVLEEEKAKARRGTKKASADLFSRLANVVAHHPFLAAGLVGVPSLAGYLATERLYKNLGDRYIKNEIEDTKMEYLRSLRQTSLLSRKMVSGKLSDEDIMSLPEDVRQRAMQKLRARTGQDYSDVLGVSSSKEAGHSKSAFLGAVTWLPSLGFSVARSMYAAPFLFGTMGVLEGARERPLNLSIPSSEAAVKEWKARTYPYMVEAKSVLPPEEFFEEIEEDPVPKTKGTKLVSDQDSDAEDRKVVNKYVQQRLRELEEADIKEKKVRGTKIISK